MSAQPPRPPDFQAEADDDSFDMGEPITTLAMFDSDASDRLVERIRRTIQRRTTTIQLLSFSWSAPGLVLKEFWLMFIEQTNRKSAGKDRGHEGKAL